MQGRIQDFKLGGGALKKIAPSGGRRENFWGISCEKSRFYAKKIIFFQFYNVEQEMSHANYSNRIVVYMKIIFNPGLERYSGAL